MALVSNQLLDEIFEAARDASLHGEWRDALLAGIAGADGLIENKRVPLLQLRVDLDWCNRNERMADGTVPLLRWLDNAGRLRKDMADAAKFRSLRDRASVPPPGRRAEPIATTGPSPVDARATAEHHERRGEWAESAKCWEAVAREDPTDPDVYERLGSARFRAGLTTQAEAAWRSARRFHQSAGGQSDAEAFDRRVAAIRAGVSPGPSA
jgi:hypothetical protein